MTPSPAHDGNLGITLATWIYALFDAGSVPDAAPVAAACAAIRAGEGEPDALGQKLVTLLREALASPEPDVDAVAALLRSWYGAEAIVTDLGSSHDREERTRAIRRYRFSRNLPWLARIIDRAPDGHVGPHWVMVEDLTEQVHILDPFPWDEVDEAYAIPLFDFQVKWELADLGGIWLR
jgi:hypothetical protein